MKRCSWCNLKNPFYVKYHDEEWGRLKIDDAYLFEMLFLESFQAGLSWECVLNKRESFRESFDNFDPLKIAQYDERKIEELMKNKNIIRNRRKIVAAVHNAEIFMNIVRDYKSFHNYLCTFTGGEILRETGKDTNNLSDQISADLYNRGMRFVGSKIIYAFLQAVGIINSHEPRCDWGDKL